MSLTNSASSNRTTDWDYYYGMAPAPTYFTRRITMRAVMAKFGKYSAPNPVIAELGGAGSRVFDAVERCMAPSAYHVIDNNQCGLDILRKRVGDRVTLHNQSVLSLDLDLQADTAFSLGLIEHFDPEGTKAATLAHLRVLKPGGIAIISFPTPTVLYRATRRAIELAGKWIFHDERPLRTAEVMSAIGNSGELLCETLIWPILLTQTLLVIRKR